MTVEKIADVEFRVWFDGDRWYAGALTWDGDHDVVSITGTGSTPITALMQAEAKARKAAR